MRNLISTNTLMALLISLVAGLVYTQGALGLVIALTMSASFLLAEALATLKVAELLRMQRDLAPGNRNANANKGGNQNDNK